ncbi:MAG: amidase [Gemmatimonadales bacterium]|nr:amidase [Gemmatimonadales bacterium]
MNSKFSRRSFVQHSSLAGLAALVSPAKALERFEVQAFELEEATIASMQEAMRSGKHTSKSLCQAYLRRIDAVDRRGPTLRSVIETNPEAIAIAEGLDRERTAGRVRGPMHGIPVLIKDNIATGDRMLTTAGSLALADGGGPAPHDAFISNRLREVGAVILGKTNLSEWANFRGRRSISGWSARGGLVKNPYALDRNACGSSSGTGAAIAASFAAAGIGTETDGSIVCPSSANSLVGIKPTLGLVSRSGIIPIAHSQDTAGPMARTVTDAAILLSAIAGPDPNDPSSPPGPLSVPERGDYTQALVPNGLHGARIGVAGGSFRGYSRHADRLVSAAIDVMKAQGAEIIDDVEIPHANDYDDAEYEVLLYEFKADLNAYLTGIGSRMRLKDLIEFNEQNKSREMPYFGQEHFERAEAKGPLTDDAYIEALARCRRLSRVEGIDVPFAKHRLDAIVAPTGGPPWPTDLVNGDHFLGGSSSAAAVSGYPNITVPVGYAFGLPVGMSLIGKPWTEATLIKLAYGYEQAAKPRRAPRFLATADLRGG